MGKTASERQRIPSASDDRAVPAYQPSERFGPCADLAEEPTPEELAALDPDPSRSLVRHAIPFARELWLPLMWFLIP